MIYNDRTKSVKSYKYEQDFDFRTERESFSMPVVMKNGTIAFAAFVESKETVLSFSLTERRLRIAQ